MSGYPEGDGPPAGTVAPGTTRQENLGTTLSAKPGACYLARAMPPVPWQRPRATAVLLTAAVVALAVGTFILLRPSEGPEPTTPEGQTTEAGSETGPRGAGFGLVVTDVLATVSGTAPKAGSIEVILVAADGSTRARGRASSDRAGARWRARFTDDDGGDVYPRAGDRISVRGATAASFVVPPLEVHVDRGAGTVAGRTAPGSTVTVEVGTGRRPQAETSSSTGAFSAALPERGALAGRTAITLTVRGPDGNVLVHQRTVPYVRASLHPGDVNGVMRPLSRVDVSLFGPDGNRRGAGQAVADAAGRYNTWLRDEAGALVRGVPGDRLVVQDGETFLTLTLPNLTTAYEFDPSRVVGTGPPRATVDLYLWHPWREGELAEPSDSIPDDGRWFLPVEIGIYPATHYYVTLHLDQGDEVTHCRQVPRLQVQPGSPVVAMDALWDMEAALALVRDGQQVASAVGGGAWTRDLALVFTAADGTPVPVRAGDEVRGSLNEMAVKVEVTDLQARIDADSGLVTGTAPAGVIVGLADQATFGSTMTVGPDGRFSLDPEGRVEAGAVAPHRRFSVYYQTPGGHVIRRLFRGPSMSPELGARTVTGTASPGADVAVSRRSEDGTRLGAASATADVTGGFTATFAADQPPLSAGETLVLTAGPVTSSLTLPALSAALDPATGELTGQAPPWSVLGAFVYVASGPEAEERHVVVGEKGTWTLPLLSPVNGLGAIDPARVRVIEVTWTAEAEEQAEIEDVVRLYVAGPLAAATGQPGS